MKILNIFLALLMGMFLLSCESNDDPVVQTPVVPSGPTNKVLVELFTNTSCVPCVEANHYLDGVYDNLGVTIGDTNVVIIRYHTTLFAGDPFYLYNQTDNNARMAFYPNSAIVNPRTFLLGSFLGNFASALWTNKLNEKLGQTRTFSVNLNNTYDPVARTGTLNIGITANADVNDLVYHVAVTESEIIYNAPNGETRFENTFRDFVTSPTGDAMSIVSGQTQNFVKSYSIDNVIDQDNVELIVFVQNTSTREVFAVEKVRLK